MSKHLIVPATILLAAILAACGVMPAAGGPYAAAPTQPSAVEPTAVPTLPTSPANNTPSAPSGEALRLVTAPQGNEARFRVREQLVSLTLPSDAVGATTSVSGAIVIQPDGQIIAGESRFVADLTTLHTDSSRRDGYIQANTLETGTFPEAVFAPTGVTGLPSPLSTSGSVAFQLTGDLTVHGVTRPVTWEVAAQIDGQTLRGTATASITFTDFGMTPPRVGPVLSVDDLIALELDFALVLE